MKASRGIWRWGVLASVLGSTSGCATILRGPTQVVTITSEPAGAEGVVEPDGIEITTPATVELMRRQVHTVHLEHPGHLPRNAYIDRDPSALVYTNLLGGGLIGVGFDLANGSAFELTPAAVHLVLEPAPTLPAGNDRPNTGDNAEAD